MPAKRPEEKIGFQCIRCTYLVENVEVQPAKCPACEGRMFREVHTKKGRWTPGILDLATEGSVAHLRKKVENCFNYEIDDDTNAKIYHPLKLVKDIKVSGSSVKILERCETCKEVYSIHQVPIGRKDVIEKLGLTKQVEKQLAVQIH